ncbi:hypothetical protein [Lactiplantibacillus mudanjiangensis]|uniref:Prophage P3 protein 13 [Lactobacillus plantarum WCFS1] n=1 Tax=Lactiplantibacillus mudanjiangensis TaxID=1296538 RepID=A0A660DZB9_9LACO|nr:hypothetical protein [Lactiplantibacillus mudanjiangensis]VDG21104.1 prophage P3 protein 13 [Lactobacillus plantarum WCFS1] [Lactiplantibacillus mudanjiangensis]VDG22963.1 prophage P3 protein 13 [Lactobacillus plantarum WCFS1] [Lactiplantibacillus mudanjiangensis]VDG29180.1 prophage P3 protein 13 [Lactobacillus plantarum WCFS1] [Lactiplantibacillus mudanjiangensis]VDG31704.1 prophage P3 protein 13 [Lactobacillus plantarum WCFS1] [Lactiplantibacillus mudanjiangensis]
MDKVTIILWIVVIISTVFQYIEGYFYQKMLSWVLPIIYSASLAWLYFNGKHMTIFPLLLAFVIGNIWFYAYYVSGRNKHDKKLIK